MPIPIDSRLFQFLSTRGVFGCHISLPDYYSLLLLSYLSLNSDLFDLHLIAVCIWQATTDKRCGPENQWIPNQWYRPKWEASIVSSDERWMYRLRRSEQVAEVHMLFASNCSKPVNHFSLFLFFFLFQVLFVFRLFRSIKIGKHRISAVAAYIIRIQKPNR